MQLHFIVSSLDAFLQATLCMSVANSGVYLENNSIPIHNFSEDHGKTSRMICLFPTNEVVVIYLYKAF